MVMKLYGPILLASAALVSACVYDDEPPRRLDGANAPAESNLNGPATTTTPAPSAPTTTATPSPMLVDVDTDQTMEAVGGEGVGVFVEYKAGGHWHIWWTCDSLLTQQSCDFMVNVSAAAGNIANIDTADLGGGFLTSPSGASISAKSTTESERTGVGFDTDPGAVITLSASVGGITDGSILFFVQDGKVNGGFTGKLTNPLQLQGNKP